jgi:hypothetical protein
MVFSSEGSSWTRVIAVQLGIIAALLVLYKVYLPRERRHDAAEQAAAREQRIQKFAQTMIVEDDSRNASGFGVDGGSLDHPQKLLEADALNEVQLTLGAPQTQFADAGGGQHLVWTGTDHKLEAAFNKGVLYNLTYSNLRTGHTARVFESGQNWQSF